MHILNKYKEEFDDRWEKNVVKIAAVNDFTKLRTLGHGTYGRVVCPY